MLIEKDSSKNGKAMYIKRVLYMILGVVVIGIGVSCLRFAGFGTDPFSCMNIGVSNHLPISYGTYQAIVNIVLFIPVVILRPRSFGIGAFVNMLGLGYVVDCCMWITGDFGFTVAVVQGYMLLRIMLLVTGICFISFGVALYMASDLGVAPYDMIGQLVDDFTHGKVPFKWARVALDSISMLIGLIMGGTFGVATFVVAFFTGPLVSWFREHVVAKMFGNL